jgi:hypothetical protein
MCAHYVTCMVMDICLGMFNGYKQNQTILLMHGSLMYLASVTRPDNSFVVSKLSRFTSNPSDDH